MAKGIFGLCLFFSTLLSAEPKVEANQKKEGHSSNPQVYINQTYPREILDSKSLEDQALEILKAPIWTVATRPIHALVAETYKNPFEYQFGNGMYYVGAENFMGYAADGTKLPQFMLRISFNERKNRAKVEFELQTVEDPQDRFLPFKIKQADNCRDTAKKISQSGWRSLVANEIGVFYPDKWGNPRKRIWKELWEKEVSGEKYYVELYCDLIDHGEFTQNGGIRSKVPGYQKSISFFKDPGQAEVNRYINELANGDRGNANTYDWSY